MKKLVLLVIIGLGCIQAFSQTIVNGRVVDSATYEPEVGAIIQVFAGTAEGGICEGYAVTDTSGLFSVKVKENPASEIHAGKHVIQIMNLGRITVRREVLFEGSVVNMGDIPVENDVQSLSGSRVTALKTLVKIDADKLTYDIENDADSKSMTVLEMLRKIPMVTVDAQDNITVNGSSSFKVYVDGRPNQMLSSNPSQMFKMMPANNIKSIEVVTNPGAKYDAEGTGGILEIKTKSGGDNKVVADGVYGTVTAGTGVNLDVKNPMTFEGGLSLNAQKGKWTLGANVNGGSQPFYGVVVESAQNFDNGSALLNRGTGNADQKMIFGEFNASYEIDSLNLITATAGYNNFYNKSTIEDGKVEFSGVSPYSYDLAQTGMNTWSSVAASVNFQHRFSTGAEKYLTFSYQFQGTPTTSNSVTDLGNVVGTTMSEGMLHRVSESNDGSYEHTFQSDFTTPLRLEGHSISAGLKYIYRINSANDMFNGIPSIYKYYNNIGAAYAEYTGTFGMLVVKTGLRYEHTWQNVDYEGSSKDFKICYPAFVPNASLQFNIGQAQNISLSYNMRIRRPNIDNLNPFVDDADPTRRSFGNPEVEAERSHRLGLAYNMASPKWVVSARITDDYRGNGISDFSYYDGNILNRTYGNILKSNSTKLNLYVNWNASAKTRVYFFADGGYSTFKGYASRDGNTLLDLSNQGWGGYGGLGAQHTFPWDLRVSTNLFALAREYDLQGYRYPATFGTLGVTKTFFDDRLSLSLQAMSNLSRDWLEFGNFSKGNGYSSTNIQRIPIRGLSFNISYTFGNAGFQLKKTARSIKNDDVISSGGSKISTSGISGGPGM